MPNIQRYNTGTLEILKLDSKIIFQSGHVINETRPDYRFPDKSQHTSIDCPKCMSFNDFNINWAKASMLNKPGVVGFHCLACDLDFERSYDELQFL